MFNFHATAKAFVEETATVASVAQGIGTLEEKVGAEYKVKPHNHGQGEVLIGIRAGDSSSEVPKLLRLRANPNQRDDENDSAVTLALNVFGKDPDYLTAAIQAGGDPNTLQSNNDPLMGAFEGLHKIEVSRRFTNWARM